MAGPAQVPRHVVRQVAVKAGVEERSVYRALRGRAVRIEALGRIRRALACHGYAHALPPPEVHELARAEARLRSREGSAAWHLERLAAAAAAGEASPFADFLAARLAEQRRVATGEKPPDSTKEGSP